MDNFEIAFNKSNFSIVSFSKELTETASLNKFVFSSPSLSRTPFSKLLKEPLIQLKNFTSSIGISVMTDISSSSGSRPRSFTKLLIVFFINLTLS